MTKRKAPLIQFHFLIFSFQVPVHVPRQLDDPGRPMSRRAPHSVCAGLESLVRLSRAHHVQAALPVAQRTLDWAPGALPHRVPAVARLLRHLAEPAVLRDADPGAQTARRRTQLLVPGGLWRVPGTGGGHARRGHRTGCGGGELGGCAHATGSTTASPSPPDTASDAPATTATTAPGGL